MVFKGTEGGCLRGDYWMDLCGSTEHASGYNHNPNTLLLMAFVADRRPGVALDYAMGDGRNALYLAKLG